MYMNKSIDSNRCISPRINRLLAGSPQRTNHSLVRLSFEPSLQASQVIQDLTVLFTHRRFGALLMLSS